ncbi:MAG: molybdate ABC transporter permease subunit [Candidatus Pacebacteria bacterium]|nr:molybdate ABC transporter permease subunit [Candidatus Paceibacterota bacterium]
MVQTLWVTFKLALVTTPILLVVGIALAWWLEQNSHKHPYGLCHWLGEAVAAVVTLPMILPATVLGFYLLVFLGVGGAGGWLAQSWGGTSLAFSFSGLVIGSLIYSLPFVVQPLRNGFATMGRQPLEVAASLRATPWQGFWRVAVPLNRRAILAAGLLGFAHTIGEFGLVLMIGGNIPGQTRVLSIAIYDDVETMNWARVHWLAGGLVLLSLAMSLTLGFLLRPGRSRQEQ